MTTNEPRWSLIVHGGARTVPADRHTRNRDGCRAAADAGAAVLRGGGSAVDAVETAVRALEDDRTFNAGSGSVPNALGEVEMDAAVMDGTTLDIGAVGALRDVRHPVTVARRLLDQRSVFLVGEGAQAFARSQGIEPYAVPPTEQDDSQHDTVGCVAFDDHGRIAVATSTGGLTDQLQGRVGDAPVPGCGFYADSRRGGVAISGDGESILRVLLATRVLEGLKDDQPGRAAEGALRELSRVGGEAGIIVLDHQGRAGIAHNSDHFAVALAASWLPETIAGVHRDEFKGFDLNG